MVYICVIIWLMYMYYRLKKSLHMLQQNLYDDDYRYFKWTIKNFSKIMLSFDLSQVFLIFFILFIPDKNLGIAEILFLIISENSNYALVISCLFVWLVFCLLILFKCTSTLVTNKHIHT